MVNEDEQVQVRELSALIVKKRTYKGQATKFVNYVDAVDEASINRPELKRRLHGYEENFKKLEEIFDEILVRAKETEIEAIIEDKLECQEAYYETCGKVDEIMQKQQESSPSNSAKVVSPINVKLPVLELPRFEGSPEDWIAFKDLFSSLINNNESLSDVQKFHYLKSCLKGNAATVIQALTICDSNYSVAWSMLIQQYENKKIIINTHMQKLFNLPTVEKESATSIRNHLNQFLKHVRALQAIDGQPSIDSFLVYLSTTKLDSNTRGKWEEESIDIESPTLANLTEFLSNRSQILDSRNMSVVEKKPVVVSQIRRNTTSHVAINNQCPVCRNEHYINNCKIFTDMNVEERYELARKNGLCYNCLRKNHRTNQCSSRPCFKCNKKHHSLLHSPQQGSSMSSRANQPVRQLESTTPSQQPSTSKNQNTTLNTMNRTSQILLGTVLINVLDNVGNRHECRALLDSGSQSNIITNEFANLLNIRQRKVDNRLHGIGGSISNIKGIIETKIESRRNNYSAKLEFLVVNVITHELPSVDIERDEFCIPGNILKELADPTFYRTGKISMLLGAEIFYELICQGQIQPVGNGPILQRTLLGWVCSGKIIPRSGISNSICNVASVENIDETLTKFWELENVNRGIKCNMTLQQIASEKHFVENVKRDDSGRFIVKLPFNQKKDNLGSSHQMALKRFNTLERKLSSNRVLHKEYSTFLEEYIEMGHMEAVEDDNIGFYLPHHAVIREDSVTTKLRVVFDGSARTTTNVSLNEIMHVGAPVQNTLFDIMLKFRKHAVVFTTDIQKMYRQVMVAEEDRHYQKILWRTAPSEEIKTYQLNTVTYGTSCAPFLATRCLVKLAEDESHKFPRACQVLQEDCYVDDIISGCDSIAEAKQMKKDLEELLQLGEFPLQKWRSNKDEVVNECTNSQFVIDNVTTKTLGVLWNSNEDTFHYSAIPVETAKVTKRTILSFVSQLFDPLGLLGGIVITAKILLQRLWQLNLHWDEAVPQTIHTSWTMYQEQLKHVSSFKLPRRITTLHEYNTIELLGFCDASERAYGACVYIKTTDQSGNISVNLLCAKSRVAPLKQQTIPRLELCGAVLLSELVTKVRAVMKINFKNIYLFTDSSIVLAWLSCPANHWSVFVGNRISAIQEVTSVIDWRHVRTQDNPADIISRGVTTTELAECDKWWFGPAFVKQEETCWPVLPNVIVKNIPEMRTVKNVSLLTVAKLNLLDRYSLYSKLHRVTAYCIRFANNCRSETRVSEGLTIDELNYANTIILKLVQMDIFREELKCLEKQKSVPRTSKLLSLHPFLDKSGVIRVGGRLHNADVPYNQRHPIILPSGHHVTKLLIKQEHLRHLHAGPRAVLTTLRTKYWPLSGMNVTKGVVRACVRCCKARPFPAAHLMGNLPAARVRPARPFFNTGVDYCGPFHIRQHRRRGSNTTKAYVAVFVCLATRAIHLELVSDLTTDACLSAIRRFISRRGIVSHLYSDNATNFVGANNELKKMMELFATTKDDILKESIQWHFIPARSPHFGGLWESAVKSCKHHLRRIAADAKLTYEEFLTLLAQVEACLNSRPLIALSEDPSDIDVLTPGHFLIGGPLTTPQEQDVTDVKENRLSHWQRVQKLSQQFWKRWSTEVLGQMQTRNKWKENRPALQKDMLVTIRDENLPPLKWRMGRIVELHPGRDQINRVASVRTSTGVVKITVTKLCRLPCD